MTDRLERKNCWIFDLDNTLYPAACDLFMQVDRRIQRFIMDQFDIGSDEARRIQKSYFHEHGTTLNGLMRHHDVAPDEFLDYVHDIDVSPVPPNPTLDTLLGQLPGRKLVYTNGSVAHADRVMRRLGVERHFDGIFDIVAANYVPKPEPEPYDALIESYQVAPDRAVMVEDIARNLAPAHALGMTTVWLKTDHHWGGGSEDDPHIHHVIDDLVDWLADVTARIGVPP